MTRQSSVVLAALIAFGPSAYAQPDGGILGLDSDGDGRVSRDEFQLPERRRGPGMLARADADGDGTVTRAEMEAAATDQPEERRDRMMQGFDRMDENGNGVVTRQELTSSAFRRVDGDGDGYVTKAEADAMHAARAERRRDSKKQGRHSEA